MRPLDVAMGKNYNHHDLHLNNVDASVKFYRRAEAHLN